MGLFGFGKRGGDVVDLAEKFRKRKEKEEQMASSKSASGSPSGSLAFFGSPPDSSETDSEVIDLSVSSERKKKLAKRILEITNKLEDLSNQIYHLQQRIEVLERKANISHS